MLDDFSFTGKSAAQIYVGIAECLKINQGFKKYYDRKSGYSEEEYQEVLKKSTTLYIGNLSFFTHESQILEYFQLAGPTERIVVGLNKRTQRPCGFAFVEYGTRQQAEMAYDLFNGGLVDQRQVRIDWDYGFSHGRQYGRGRSGGQVRDEFSEVQDRERPKPRERPDEASYRGKDHSKRQRTDDANEQTNVPPEDDPWMKEMGNQKQESQGGAWGADEESKQDGDKWAGAGGEDAEAGGGWGGQSAEQQREVKQDNVQQQQAEQESKDQWKIEPETETSWNTCNVTK